MVMLTDLADACRKSRLKVVEVDGWRSRGHGPLSSVQTIVVHHTATAKAAAGNYPSLGIVRDGRSGLPGPLSQLGLGRDGTVYVIAAGVAYHAGEVGLSAWNNWNAIGIEAEHDGLSSWPPAQYAAYVQLCAALVEHYRLAPDMVLGHKEVARPVGRKIDPNFNMDRFRDAVASAQTQEDDMPNYRDWSPEDRKALADDVAAAVGRAVLDADMNVNEPKGSPRFRGVTLRTAIKSIYSRTVPEADASPQS